MTDDLAQLESAIGYRFADRSLLTAALTHRSLAISGNVDHNQRLEFLGDAVLGLAVADMLYTLYPQDEEGALSKRLVGLVNGKHLAEIAAQLKLGDYLQLAPGEEEQGGRVNPSNLEDACEALIGAVYLDGGMPAVKQLIEQFWLARAKSTKAPPQDPKTALQEWVQARGLALPEYKVISAEGPSHAPLFVIEVAVPGYAPVRAEAGTKKAAERAAAEKMLAQVG